MGEQAHLSLVPVEPAIDTANDQAPIDWSVTDPPQGTTADGFTIELAFGAVSRKLIITVKHEGLWPQITTARTIPEAKESAEGSIAQMREQVAAASGQGTTSG